MSLFLLPQQVTAFVGGRPSGSDPAPPIAYAPPACELRPELPQSWESEAPGSPERSQRRALPRGSTDTHTPPARPSSAAPGRASVAPARSRELPAAPRSAAALRQPSGDTAGDKSGAAPPHPGKEGGLTGERERPHGAVLPPARGSAPCDGAEGRDGGCAAGRDLRGPASVQSGAVWFFTPRRMRVTECPCCGHTRVSPGEPRTRPVVRRVTLGRVCGRVLQHAFCRECRECR